MRHLFNRKINMATMYKNNATIVVVFILASLGVFDAGYLSYAHLFGKQVCGAWSGCSYVLSSPYSRIFGVPVSTLGLGVYLCLAFLALCARDAQRKIDVVRWLFYISLTGSLLAICLLYLQAFIIQHWCYFCLFSTLLMFSIFVLSLWHRVVKDKGFMALLKTPDWGLGAKPMLALLILPSVIFLGMEKSIGVFSDDPVIPDSPVVARIGEKTITLGEVDHSVRLGLNQIEWQRYELRLLWLENRLLSMEAERQGLSEDDLKENNIDDVISVSEEEIQNVYNDNQNGQLAAVPYEKVKEQIADFLKTKKKRLRRQEYLAQLKKQYNASFSLPKPLPLTVESNPRKGPEKGPAAAALTVVIFTDFECPYCDKAYNQVKGLHKRNPQDVRIIFRHFPLDMHKNAHTAAYAAACAHLQGKFWPYADLLFNNQGELENSKLYDYAEQVGLDMEQFEQSMKSGQGKEVVDADIEEGSGFGIDFTPALFFNGHFIDGLPRAKQLQRIIDLYIPESGQNESND